MCAGISGSLPDWAERGVFSDNPTFMPLKVADAVRHALSSSSVFISSFGKKPGSLIVFIPTHVSWIKKGGQITIQYTVLFRSVDDQELGSSKGTSGR
jgi:hypothetical protein